MEQWYKNSFRRCLVDMHIPDWDERFLSEFDSEKYIRHMVNTGVDAAYLYATSCVGLCNYPSRVGQMHKGLRGRDIIRELTEGLRREGIHPIVYINIWSKWAYDRHPEWRCVSQDGRTTAEYLWGQPGRYGVCCCNTGYREYLLEIARELASGYVFDGFWVDMISWKTICYCPECKKRFLKETGYEIPGKINWRDPAWRAFLRSREVWIEDFFEEIIGVVKQHRPDVSVVCNSSYYPTYLHGTSNRFLRMGEFIGGDFEMDRLEHTFNCKFFNSVSANKPFEFLGSVMDPALNEHSIIKTEEKLQALMFSTLANNGRYGFIDAIDPVGSLNERVYRRMKKIFDIGRQYEKYLRSDVRFCADVGIYTNPESRIDLNLNGSLAGSVSPYHSPHGEAVKGAALALIEHHIPFEVLTENDLDRLDRCRILLLPDLYVISERERQCFEAYLKQGGCICASGHLALYDTNGERVENGMLRDCFGLDILSDTEDAITYIRPCEQTDGLLLEYTERHPLTVNETQTLVRNRGGTALGMLTLPYVFSGDPVRFSSAISDPPGNHTAYPSIVYHEYGKGRTVYCAGVLERCRKDDQVSVWINLIRRLQKAPFAFESDAPKCVEITLYEQREENRLVLNLLNVQKQLPNLPVYNISICLHPERPVRSVRLVPEEKEIPFEQKDGAVRFLCESLDIFQMFLIEYQPDSDPDNQ